MQDYMQRWELSKKYMIAVATLMSRKRLQIQPVEAGKTFAEQLTHICIGIDWHAQMLINQVTHHRAQLLVYLRKKGIQPPEYVDYQ